MRRTRFQSNSKRRTGLSSDNPEFSCTDNMISGTIKSTAMTGLSDTETVRDAVNEGARS